MADGWGSKLINIFRRRAVPQANGSGKTSGPRGVGARAQQPRGARSISAEPLAAERYEEPRDLPALTAEMRKDYQVKLVEIVLAANVKSVDVTISVDAADSSGRADALAEHLQTLWDETKSSMLAAYGDGRVAYEKCFEYDAKANLHYPRKLEPLPFEMTTLRLTNDGAFDGVDLKTSRGTTTIPADKAWWLALDPTALEPHGRSRFLGAMYEVWRERRSAIENRKKFLRRYIVRGGIAHIPPTTVDEQAGEVVDNFAATAEAIDNLYSGGTLLLPNDRIQNADGSFGDYEYDFTEAKTEMLDPAPVDAVIDGLDQDQLQAGGIPPKTVIEGEAVGSFAMVTQQMRILYSVVEDLLDQFTRSFQRYVIDKCVDHNFDAADGVRITIAHASLTSGPDSLVVEIVKAILTSPQLSPLVLSGVIDLGQMLEAVGVPVTDDVAAKLRQMLADAKAQAAAQQAAAAAPQPGGFGAGGFPRPAPAPTPDPAGPPRTMALAPLAGFTPPAPPVPGERPAAVPTQEQLTQAALAEVDGLLASLRELVLSGGSREQMDAVVQRINRLLADTRTAARIVGMLSPWLPQLQDVPQGGAAAEGIDSSALPARLLSLANLRPRLLSIESLSGGGGVDPQLPPGDEWRYPFIDDAVAFLAARGVGSVAELKDAARQDLVAASTATPPAGLSVDDLLALRSEIATAAQTGEAFEQFQQRVDGQFALTSAQLESVYRTETKTAYVAGMERTLDVPSVSEAFPYVLYVATLDTRTRQSHIDLDGFVCSRNDPAYKVLRRVVSDWNCRCAMVPLNEEDAKGYGIKTVADLPASTRAKYGI